MPSRLPLRLLLATALSLGLALLLLLLLHATDVAFRVYEHLREAPWWFAAGYAAALLLLLAGAGWALLRLLLPRRPTPQRAPPQLVHDEQTVVERLSSAEAAGVDVLAARRELEALRRRREAGEVHVALFGRVSTGKSSVVAALVPGAEPEVDVRAGTTRDIVHYQWASPAGDRLVLTDLPGLHEPDGGLDRMAREEAVRAHVVIYLVDNDLTRDQFEELRELLELKKPTILALNKMDLYRPDELALIRSRLAQRLAGAERTQVVAVSAATRREVLRVLPDGEEQWVSRPCEPRLDDLVAAVQRAIDDEPETLDQLRDSAVFTLVARQVDERVAAERVQRADRVVAEYTRKAVVGALAAVSPGTDVVIQGYLGMRLIQELAGIYEVPARDLDVQEFLRLASGRAKGVLTLTLALAGNALKAFPGLGTIGGGLLHAVAYGLIFDSLGRAVAQTLESRGRLATQPALRSFEELISGNLEARARDLARVALGQGRDGAARPPPR